MANPKPDWSSFTKRIFIDRPIELVYRAWTIPANITQWFLEEARYITEDKSNRADHEQVHEGDRHSWRWHNYDFTESGRVIQANGRDRFSFTFGKGGHVHIELTPKNGGTDLILIQDEIPTDEEGKMNYYVGCATGWTFWLANLKAWLEYGITLHARGLAQSETKDLVNS